MHDESGTLRARVNRVLVDRVGPAGHPATVPVELAIWQAPDRRISFSEAVCAEYVPFAIGTSWGAPWSTSWFRATATVPSDWAGRRVEALFDLGFTGAVAGGQAEALVYDRSGLPIKAVAPDNQYVPVANPSRGGEEVVLWVEAAANPDLVSHGFRPTVLGEPTTAGTAPLYRFARADLAVLDEQVWHLKIDLEVLRDLADELGAADPRRHEILRALEQGIDALDMDDIAGTAATARGYLARVLTRRASPSTHTVYAVGHAHIDSAWLWPLRETVRKTSRTFANVVELATQYPDFVFAASQAQQYAWAKQHYPELYRRLQETVKNGQWVPVGGMWVEADANLPGGEALARQLIHGKRFFLDEFEVECEGVWLPDSFGLSAALPQLATLAGMRWLLSQKLSWNDTNRFPHHTFWWEGIDGSRLFTHFPPMDTYASTLSGAELAFSVRNYAEKGRGSRSLAMFGHGDGGGGPTREMVERARRLHDLDGSPRVVMEDPNRFFHAAEAEYPDAPTWSGELYLELHRGTFTSQARTKVGNRRSEHLLREAELWAVTARVLGGFDYPHDDLDRLWKQVLLHQFHDILPGTSIAWVHREAEATYAGIRAELESIVGSAAATIATNAVAINAVAAKLDLPEVPVTPAAAWVLNAGPFDRAEVVSVPAELATGAGWAEEGVPQQHLEGGALAAYVRVPALAAQPLRRAAPLACAVAVADRVLDNGLVRVELDDDGTIASVLDLMANREVIAPGHRANVLQLHADLPGRWDAWDIDRSYHHRHSDLTSVDSTQVLARGPLVAAVRIARSFGASQAIQTISLRAASKRIDISTEIQWYEREKLLKVAFPLDLHADRTAAEIQFGHVYRPTHTNTSWDAAKFEVYAHRWIHASEAGYGVGLLTDATYGYDASRTGLRAGRGSVTTVRLSLLRAARFPDPDADQGVHRFTYALLPGADLRQTIAEGYALNLPLRVVAGSDGPAPPPVVSVEGDAVVEAVKLADDRSGDVVVRLYEPLGGRAKAVLRSAFGVTRAQVVDLLERPGGGEPSSTILPLAADGAVAVDLRPFQVLTVRLCPARTQG